VSADVAHICRASGSDASRGRRFTETPSNLFDTACAGLALALLCGFSSACSTSKSSTARVNDNGKVFAVTAEKTAFFRFGPQQGNGPDESLPKDTLMTLIRPSFGYCKVQLMPSAKEGYVASEDIRPAPPTLLAALNPPAPTGASERENFDVHSTEPPPPETLPDPDLPPTAAEPSPQ
jgi:hypothetical protein